MALPCGRGGGAGAERIAPNTALNFLLAGSALLILASPRLAIRRRAVLAAQSLALLTIVIAALTVIGYTFGVRQFYGVLRFFPMALHTGLNFFVLAFAMLAARPDVGIAALISADDEGGRIARRLVPTALLLPLVLGSLSTMGASRGLYSGEFGVAVFVVTSMIALTAVVLVQVRSTATADRALAAELAERRRAEIELKRANDQLVVAREAAEAGARAKAQFLANMSHEIRTPLNAVIGMSSLLEDSPLSGEQREFVQTVRASGEHLLTVINDILDFSKIDAGKLDLEHLPFDLRACVEQCIDLVALSAARKNVELAFLIESGPPAMLVGDAGRVRQILANLLSNAVKFTKQGEVVVQVDATPLGDGRVEVHVSVRDTGTGIPADRLDRLFQSFSQVDASTSRRFGGTGLGLAISKLLAEMMGGRIWVESELDRGSTFHFTIQSEIADTPVLVPRRKRPAVLAGRRVLIVDDNATNRRILSAYVVTWEMVPLETADPREALAWIERGDLFDLLITDYEMPGMDGLDLVQALRATSAGRRLPIILASSIGTGKEDARRRGIDVDAHLIKPIKPAQVLEAVNRLLGDQPAERGESAAGQALFDADLGVRHPLRILLAEDNAVNQKVALAMLAKLGYRADLAGDGWEVLEALERQRYDVVLMDVHMPRMDGLEASRTVCERWPAPERPRIVAMTADAMAGDRERCIDAGMSDYVTKPVRAAELAEALARCGRVTAPAVVGAAPPETSPGDATAVLSSFDLETLKSSLGDEVFRDVVDTYIAATPAIVAQTEALLASGTSDELTRVCHDLKSTSGAVGARRLAVLARVLETRASTGDLEGVAGLFPELRGLVDETCAALQLATAPRS